MPKAPDLFGPRQIAGWSAVVATLGFSVCLLAGWVARETALSRNLRTLGAESLRRLDFTRLSLEEMLARYESLPRVIAMEGSLKSLLAHPRDDERLSDANRYLEKVTASSGISAAFLLDATGKALASSNFREPTSFVGRNYAYRPYFIEAVKGGLGRFYGVGATTGIPGYFLAAPIEEDGEKIGAAVVKVSLGDFESALRESGETVLLVDGSGVVFLTSVEEWKYRTLKQLSDQALVHMRTSRQYRDWDLIPLDNALDVKESSSLVKAALPRRRPEDFLVVSHPAGSLGWRLLLLTGTRPERQGALLAGIAAGFATAFLLSVAVYVRLNRRRIRERREADAALQRAHDELELRITERTADLVATNASLEERVEALKATEEILREARDQAVQAGKLAVLGQMAAGISHEVNQPLTALLTFTDNAVQLLDRGRLTDVRENLGRIGDMADRVIHIVSEIRTFARRSASEQRETGVADAVLQALMLVEPRRRQLDVTIDAALSKDLSVRVDPLRLEQVLVNILSNALDAAAPASVRRVTIEEGRSGASVWIAVRDSGAGIPKEVLPRIFEPFFTTKPRGQGLGLGLSISAMIVEEQGGHLEARNVEGAGAEFRVVLRGSDG